jgi:hypothetical protein
MGVSCSDRFTNPHREAASTDGQDSGSCSKLSAFYMIFIADHGRELFHVSWKHGKALDFERTNLVMQTGIRLG